MIIKRYCCVIASFILLTCFTSSAYSQRYMHDSTYYKTYPNSLTLRVYSIKNYANFTFSAIGNNSDLKYKSNTNTNLGIGATYDNVSLNLSTGIGFLNKGNDDKGKTKSIDIQLYFLPRKWVSDLVFIHNKGFYVAPQGYASSVPNSYYYRPDVKMDLLGFSVYRNLNYKKFSMRSPFNQNEWIKKSAGSLLIGGNIFYQSDHSDDSSIVPVKVASYFSSSTFKKFHFLSFGPGIGYGYTFAFAKHYYIQGSAIINGNINFATDGNGTISNKKTSVEPNGIFKAAVGYNGDVWNVSLNWAGQEMLIKQDNVSETNSFPSGFVRLMVAKRIMLKKQIPVISNIIHAFFGNTD